MDSNISLQELFDAHFPKISQMVCKWCLMRITFLVVFDNKTVPNVN